MAKKKTKNSGHGQFLIVGSKSKDAGRKNNRNVSSDIIDALSGRVQEMILDAVSSCKSNVRKTVRRYDF